MPGAVSVSACGLKLRRDQRHARQLALRDEAAVGPHQHPVPVIERSPWRATARRRSAMPRQDFIG